MHEINCPRSSCDESFTGPNGLAELRKERHLAVDHQPPWDEIDNYPRAPGNR